MENKISDNSVLEPVCTGNQFRIILQGLPDVRKILEEMEADISLNIETGNDE